MNDHIFYSHFIGYAVADEDVPINPQQGRASYVFKVETLKIFVANALFADQFIGCFGLLEDDVADKTVTNQDVCLAVEQLIAFYIADEIIALGSLHQLIGRTGYQIALFLFLSDIDEPYPRVVYFVNMLGINGSNQPILKQYIRLAVGIDAYVQQNSKTSVVLRHRGSDHRPD